VAGETASQLACADGFEPLDDPVEQWLRWEETANLAGFRTSTQPVAVEVADVPAGAVRIEASANAPPDVLRRFLHGDRVRLPRHPLNRDPAVSFADAPVVERWLGRFTSSRTLVIPVPPGESLFSFKLATDYPHPWIHQPEKTKLREEADWSMDWFVPVDRIDALLGPDPSIRLVREVLVLLVEGSETACMVRDLRLFQDGHYYLPAFSLPWVGRQIASRWSEPFDEFWARHYAERVGRAKGRLFARYGLWYETPNPQNILIQLDPELAPTGVLVFRDLGDAWCTTDTAKAEGVPWTRLESDLRPETQTSFWAFGESQEHSVAPAALADWYNRHDRAFCAELAGHFPAAAPPPDAPAPFVAWSAALRGDAGTRAIAEGFAALMREAKA
jgi:hypothetical protein